MRDPNANACELPGPSRIVNAAIGAYADRYDENFVVSTLDDELAVNPYLRFNDAPIIALLKNRHLPVETAYQRWQGIMSID